MGGDLDVRSVLQAARAGAGISPLYRWLWDHHEQLLPELAKRGVNWAAMAQQFQEADIKAGRGSVATAEVVRQTWNRVCRAKGRGQGGVKKKPQAADLPPDKDEQAIEPATKPKFGFAKPRG